MTNPEKVAQHTELWCYITGSLLWTLLVPTTVAQVALPPRTVDPAEEDPDRRKTLQLIFETETALNDRQFLTAAEAFDAAWALAVRREDPLLTLNSDAEDILQPGEHRVQAGARSRLENIYEGSSVQFRNAYQEHVRTVAETAELTAVKSGRTQDLTDFILRYQFTGRAQNALQQLIRLRLSRGEFLQAALQYGRLLRLQNDTSAQSRTNLAVMWWNAGLPEEAVDYLRDVVADSAGESVNVEGHDTALPAPDEDLLAWLKVTSGLSDSPAHNEVSEWMQPGGNYRRTMSQSTGPALLKEAWKLSSFDCIQFPDLNRVLQPLAGDLSSEAAIRLKAHHCTIPAAAPLTVRNLLIYRCVANIQAVDATTGEIQWETIPLDRQMERVLDSLNRDDSDGIDRVSFIRETIQNALFHHLVRANSSGQLTSDGRYLYAIEDSTSETMRVELDEPVPPGAVPVNYLRAYDVMSGSFRGQAGGNRGAGGAVNPMAGMYFLGAPLVLGDRIYLLAENDQGIFLLQLRTAHPWGDIANAEVDLRPVRSQLLTIPAHSLRKHPARKYAGVIPSFSRGLLICNTCDGQVIAVSAEDHSVRWIYRYAGNVSTPELNREIAVFGNLSNYRQSDNADLEARWLDSIPQIAAGRVFVTPRDSDRLVCLDMETGAELWTHPRGDMRRIASLTDSQVVLTGMTTVHCFDSASGHEKWKLGVDEGVISGAGVSDGRLLHVPTSAPSVVTIDLTTGRQIVVQPVHDRIPGNLLSVGGSLYSQSLTEISCLQTPAKLKDSPLAAATRKYFDGHIADAERLLKEALADPLTDESDQQTARELLITSLLESLRLDYRANTDCVSELEQLISNGESTDEQLTSLISLMVGMSPGDTTAVSSHWRKMHRLERYRSQLQHLVYEGLLTDPDESVETVAATIIRLLDETSASTRRLVKSSDVSLRESRRVAGMIRNALQLRSDEQQAELRDMAGKMILPKILEAASKDEATWWIDQCLHSGFTAAAVEAFTSMDHPALNEDNQTLQRELVLMAAIDDLPQDKSNAYIERLLAIWQQNERSDLVRQFVNRSEKMVTTPKGTPQLPSRIYVSRSLAVPRDLPKTETLQKILRESDKQKLPVPWSATPVVTESPAHSVQQSSPASVLTEAPRRSIPVYGPVVDFLSGNLSSGLLTRQSMLTTHEDVIAGHSTRVNCRAPLE